MSGFWLYQKLKKCKWEYLFVTFIRKKSSYFFSAKRIAQDAWTFAHIPKNVLVLYSCCQTLGNMCYTVGSGCTCFLTAVDAVFRIVDTVDGASCSCLHNPKMWAIPAVASCRAVLAAAMNVVNAAMLLAALLAQHVSCAIPSKACFILGVDAVESNLSWTCWH